MSENVKQTCSALEHDEHKPALEHDHTAESKPSSCCGKDTRQSVVQVPVPKGMVQYHINEMDCPVEQEQIRQALASLKTIKKLHFNLTTRVVGMEASDSTQAQALELIRALGFNPKRLNTVEFDALQQRGFWRNWGKIIIALILALSAELLSLFFLETELIRIVEIGLALAAIFLSGWSVFVKGLQALRHGNLSINALMAVAVFGAFLIGEWPEAAMVMSLFALSEALEARAVDRARDAIQGLLSLSPEVALVQQSEGQWQEQLVSEIAVGRLLRVGPGQRIALDGVIIQGQSSVDQASLTGESLPVDKLPGDQVFAGTMNQTGSFVMQTQALATETTLAKIIHAVEQAQNERAPTQRLIDHFATYYTPAVFLLSLAVMLLSPWFFAWTWTESFYKGLVLLVIACPCALVIAIPVTIVSSLTRATKMGLIIKGGVYLEQARLIKAVAFDKTGTITTGKPVLVNKEVGDTPLSGFLSVEEIEHITHSLVSLSDHPVSKAIIEGLKVDPDSNMAPVTEFEQLSGRGIQGRIHGQYYALLNHRTVQEKGLRAAELKVGSIDEFERAGQTVSLLVNEDRILAVYAVADTIKPHAAQAIEQLQARGIHTVMLSGDNSQTAQVIAREAGIAQVQGDLLPTNKLSAIQLLRSQYGVTAMVGDGMNDAPALAQADIGFAMGGIGTDIAMETADVVVMNDDLRRIVQTIDLSAKTHQVLWQNIILALGIKGIFFVLTLFSLTSMWMAVFADVGVSLLVVLNGMRLLTYQPPSNGN